MRNNEDGPLSQDVRDMQATIDRLRARSTAAPPPNGRRPQRAKLKPREPWDDDEPETADVAADLSGWTKSPNALPLVLLAHGLKAREILVLDVVLGVAGWGFRSRRWASIGCRAIAARLGGQISPRTALRSLRMLADGYRDRNGALVEGHRLIRIMARKKRSRTVIDLQPLMDELAAVWPDGDEPLRGRGHARRS